MSVHQLRGWTLCRRCRHRVFCRADHCTGNHEAVCGRCQTFTAWWTAVACAPRQLS